MNTLTVSIRLKDILICVTIFGVPTLCILNIGTVPMMCILNLGTLPFLWILYVGTAPAFRHSHSDLLVEILRSNFYANILNFVVEKGF